MFVAVAAQPFSLSAVLNSGVSALFKLFVPLCSCWCWDCYVLWVEGSPVELPSLSLLSQVPTQLCKQLGCLGDMLTLLPLYLWGIRWNLEVSFLIIFSSQRWTLSQFSVISYKTFQNVFEVNLPYHSWQIHVLSGSLMDITSFWTEHKNFEMFSFHWEVGVSAEVRNSCGLKHRDQALCCHEEGAGLPPCKDRSLHKAEKWGQSREGTRPDSSDKRCQ